MPKLPIISGVELIKALSKIGFAQVRQKGSHVTVKKHAEGKLLIATIPLHPALDTGTLLGILRKLQISREDFLKLLAK
ncbi:MAG: type II toxin-antitoxin system HicA family toxin [Candidatus Micrarchaeota archaeon]